ncbi:MAG: glycosyltransferase [Chloroflexi bacterium]|nr:glycosyltransferase [Chloroflexota bacterium]
MLISVIIPVHNGGRSLACCIDALNRSTRPPDEIVVVDDASTDSAITHESTQSTVVICLEGLPRGPAYARNRGVEASHGSLIVFVDADVLVHGDALERLECYAIGNPDVAGFFGSYDDDPPERGLVTRYKNLLHHFVHQNSGREASTFWAGFGAVRRAAFEAVGGFDESYTAPSIEDIELGARLRSAGFRVWLCSDLQVTHLKRWRLWSLLRTDIVSRAIPWTRLMVSQDQMINDLNLDARSRVSSVLAWTFLLCVVASIVAQSLWPVALLVSIGLSLLCLNGKLYIFFASKGGMLFAAGAVCLHVTYLLYSSAFFGIIAIPIWLRKTLADRTRGGRERR